MNDQKHRIDFYFFRNPTNSILNHWRGAYIFGVFNAILLATLMYQTHLFSNGVRGASMILILVVAIAQTLLSLFLTRFRSNSSALSTIVHSVVISTSYSIFILIGILVPQLGYNYECYQCNNGPFIAAVAVQSIVLGLVFAVYQRPLIPESVIRTENFEVHSTNWWRMMQALMTFTIATGIGLFAQFLIDSDSVYVGKLIPFILGVGIGILSILFFIFKKMFVIEYIMSNENQDYST